MITEYGMSDRLGARKFGQNDGEVFLGRDMGHQRDYSEQIAAAIDDEVRGLIESAHDVAWEILVQYRDVLDDLVLKLMDKETLTKDEVLAIFAPIQRRPLQASYTGWGKRKPSDQPPVLTPRELALLGPADVRELTGDSNGVSMAKPASASNGANGYGSNLGAPASPPPPTPGPAPTVEPPSSQPGS
jgi:cell division protease FtsH